MADEPEDVLELEEALEIEEQGEEGQGAAEAESDEEDLIGFGDEEAAPAPEEQTSTVRQLRDELRRQQRENAELRKATAKPKVELGARPTLADVDYDEDKFEAALDDWKARKAQVERDEQESQEQERKGAQEWADRTEAYTARKAQLKIPNFEVAETAVFTALPQAHQALLMKSGKAAELVAALHRSPGKLDELSKLDLTDAAMLVGELRSKLTVTKRKPPAAIDTPLRGNSAGPGGNDRELARLEKEADKTGDRSKLIDYKRKLKAN